MLTVSSSAGARPRVGCERPAAVGVTREGLAGGFDLLRGKAGHEAREVFESRILEERGAEERGVGEVGREPELPAGHADDRDRRPDERHGAALG